MLRKDPSTLLKIYIVDFPSNHPQGRCTALGKGINQIIWEGLGIGSELTLILVDPETSLQSTSLQRSDDQWGCRSGPSHREASVSVNPS